MSTRITDELAPYFAKAFEEHPEITGWDLSFNFLPDPERHGFAGYLGLYAQTPGVVLDSTIRYTAMLSPAGQTEETVRGHVQDAYEKLMEGRADQQGEQDRQLALADGSDKLILPDPK